MGVIPLTSPTHPADLIKEVLRDRHISQSLFANLIGGREYHLMEDFSRKNPWKLMTGFVKQIRMIKETRPIAVISTGAAPGLAALMAAKVCGVKTIWIDSIANVQHLSASGRLARKFVSRIYTQWPALADEKVIYVGNVLNQ